MFTFTDEQLDWPVARFPDAPRSPESGRPPTEKLRVFRGIFWILDNGAKWKDLPGECGSKSTVHRWFQQWVNEGVFDRIMREAGRCVETRGVSRLYECLIDGALVMARGGGNGIDCTEAAKTGKIMVLVDARGFPVAMDTRSATCSGTDGICSCSG